MRYTKLFDTILDSTVWQQPLHIKVVWITLLAKKDRDGRVWCSIPGLARCAGVTLDQVQEALECFKATDELSTTTAFEGRRIQAMEGGWVILNATKYDDMCGAEDRRAYWALKQREARARKNRLARVSSDREAQVMQHLEEET